MYYICIILSQHINTHENRNSVQELTKELFSHNKVKLPKTHTSTCICIFRKISISKRSKNYDFGLGTKPLLENNENKQFSSDQMPESGRVKSKVDGLWSKWTILFLNERSKNTQSGLSEEGKLDDLYG